MIARIALTPGEPAGIGPDLIIQMAQQAQSAEFVVIASAELMQQRAAQLGLPLQLLDFAADAPRSCCQPGQLRIVDIALRTACIPGQLQPANASYVLETLDRAIEGCRQGVFDALVTAPVHKGVINEAGIPFSGHTEFLAQKTATEQVVMMLATEQLRVALVTTHLPLQRVAEQITTTQLERVIRILHRDLSQHFGLSAPRIHVLGLNPHAGEGGHMGREEVDIIIPLLERLCGEGMQLVGPLPADTAFTPKALTGCDAVLAMYHDQGLPVLKYQGFGRAVNITLGLPIIRTSVDHGTALELAGSGQADGGSLRTAIDYALQMSRHRRASTGLAS